MKKAMILMAACLAAITAMSQDMKSFRLYDHRDNAEKSIAEAVQKARDDGKHVFIQVGGNWCSWCARFNNLVTTDAGIDSVIKANYVVYHLNYSKENKNGNIMAQYDYPQRFGFPVFLILNGKGELIHTQNSVYLEEGDGYDTKTVTGFLADWSPAALDPKNYQD